jgi:hypothetical protein
VCAQQERLFHATTTRDGTYKNPKPKPQTTLTQEARMDNVENMIVVLVVDLNCFRSNTQKRLTKDCSDQMCTPLGVDGDRRRIGGW